VLNAYALRDGQGPWVSDSSVPLGIAIQASVGTVRCHGKADERVGTDALFSSERQ